MLNEISLNTVCGALCYAMGVKPPEHAAAPNEKMVKYVDETLEGKKVDRIFMFNPDAVGQWISDKYADLLQEVSLKTDLEVPLRSPFKPVTPVCFATMYTGALPDIHGIHEYQKPVLTVDTIFDAMARAGKRCAIIALRVCSIGSIFLDRDVDYFFEQSPAAAVACAARLIMEDKHDLIVCYNGNYDYWQHRVGPEGTRALAELRSNSCSYAMLDEMIQKNWKHHNTLIGFAMDHGCHLLQDPIVKDTGAVYWGTHCDESPEDMNICHRYKIHKAEE